MTMTKRKSTPRKDASTQKKTNVQNLKTMLKSGTNALQEIRKLQHSTNLLIPRAPFLRLVKEIVSDETPLPMRFTTMALDALREAAESYLVHTMEDANRLARHAKRVTLFPIDIELLMSLRRDFGGDGYKK